MDHNVMNKLSFASQYGSEAHKAKVQPKIDHLVANYNPADEHSEQLVKSPALKRHQLHDFLHHTDDRTRRWAASNPSLNEHDVDYIAKHGDYHQKHGLTWNRDVKLKPEHIDGIIAHQTTGTQRTHPAKILPLIRPKELKDHHWKALLNHSDTDVALSAAQSSKAPMHHLLDIAVEHPDYVISSAARLNRRQRIAAGEKD